MARLCAASDDDQNWVALGDKYTLYSVLYAVLQTLHCIMNSYNPPPLTGTEYPFGWTPHGQ